MATDEEYLDSLLKTLEGNDTDIDEEIQTATDDDWKAGLDDLLGFTDTKETAQESNAEDDMLALLQSIKDDENGVSDDSIAPQADESNDDFFNEDELLNLFAEAENHASADAQEQVEEKAEPESEPVMQEEKKKKSRLSKKKKKKEDGEAEPGEKASDSETENGKEKKVGFWGGLLKKLTEEVEEEEKIEDNFSDGSVELLGDEVTEGKKGKKESKKKKDKKGKKGKKGKENPDVSAENLEEIAEAAVDKKAEKKKKKERKKKEKEEKAEKPKEKSPKILSKKSLLILIAFCATLIGAVVALSFFLNDYADKKKAREAFYVGNYEEAYVLLYDKNLNESDKLIYHRIEVVLQLERTLDTYETYKKLGHDPEALDALLQGICKYESMQMTDQYGADDELAAVYQRIVETLDQDYGIALEDAKEINTYDDLTYTNVIYSIINGEEYVKPGEEEEKPQPPQDVLTEEEAIIQMDTENEGA